MNSSMPDNLIINVYLKCQAFAAFLCLRTTRPRCQSCLSRKVSHISLRKYNSLSFSSSFSCFFSFFFLSLLLSFYFAIFQNIITCSNSIKSYSTLISVGSIAAMSRIYWTELMTGLRVCTVISSISAPGL